MKKKNISKANNPNKSSGKSMQNQKSKNLFMADTNNN